MNVVQSVLRVPIRDKNTDMLDNTGVSQSGVGGISRLDFCVLKKIVLVSDKSPRCRHEGEMYSA